MSIIAYIVSFLFFLALIGSELVIGNVFPFKEAAFLVMLSAIYQKIDE